MRVHHLNCGSLCPLGGCLVTGEGTPFSKVRLVCHCLLIESDAGLILVDTGLGIRDMDAARERLGSAFLLYSRPLLDVRETAAHRIEELGFRRSDVRHIVVTHLDIDHAGGLSDFPDAEVHVLAEEHRVAVGPQTEWRYQQAHWAHEPKWRLHKAEGERWFGFDAVQALEGSPDILLVPLAGHTAGHAGVAVRTPRGWMLHAGDAYFFHGQLTGDRMTPLGTAALEHALDAAPATRRANTSRLAALAKSHPELTIFSSHDPLEYARAVA